MTHIQHYSSPLGRILLAADETGLMGLWFDGQKYFAVGSPFRQEVWKILLQIPYGETVTYGDISKQLVKGAGIERMSAQAVGSAVGHNEVSIIIPCHRVVGTNGSLTGYAGGFDRKIKLLELEKADMSQLFVPKKVMSAMSSV